MTKWLIFQPKLSTHQGCQDAALACGRNKVAAVIQHIYKEGCLVMEADSWQVIENALDETDYRLITKVKEAIYDSTAVSK